MAHWSFLLILILFFPTLSYAGALFVPGPAGTWDVEKVAPGDDQLHAAYRPDDPLLLYRQLRVTASLVEFDFIVDACRRPTWKTGEPVKLYHWLSNTYVARPGQNIVSSILTDLNTSIRDQTVRTLKVNCDASSPNEPIRYWPDWTFVQLSADRLLLNYDGEALLLLRKRSEKNKVAPSYDCKRASAPSEIAICNDADLAGYDKSVAAAYQWLLKSVPEKTTAAKREQNAWLAKRNACGGNRDCIVEEMTQRISNLAQEANSGAVGE